MDEATGLLYIGNGQYYDPATGRFLNRNVRPEQTNPYVPWSTDPTGALFSPLLLLAMVFGNKKKRGKYDQLMILLVICILFFMILSCGLIDNLKTIWNAMNSAFSPAKPPVSPYNPGGITPPSITPDPTVPPVINPETPCPRPPFYKTEEGVNISAYFTPLDTDYIYNGWAETSQIPANESQKLNNVDWLSADGYVSEEADSNLRLAAPKALLWDPELVCTQGLAKVNGRYLSCTYPDCSWEYGKPPKDMGFEWKYNSKTEATEIAGRYIQYETAARCSTSSKFSENDVIEIPALSNYMHSLGDYDEFFTIKDTGVGLCANDSIDIYLGEGKAVLDIWTNFTKHDSVKVNIYRNK